MLVCPLVSQTNKRHFQIDVSVIVSASVVSGSLGVHALQIPEMEMQMRRVRAFGHNLQVWCAFAIQIQVLLTQATPTGLTEP